MYKVSTRRCARLTREVCWIGTTVSNLPTFDGLNPLETFLLDFEKSVPTQHQKDGGGHTKTTLQTRYNVVL
jgi:hypothetical protein